MNEKPAEAALSFDRRADLLSLRLAGPWKLPNRPPPAGEVREEIESGPPPRRLSFDTQELSGWDSSLLIFLAKVGTYCAENGIEMAKEGLPPGVRRLLELSTAVPERKGARREERREPLLAGIGKGAIASWASSQEMLGFLGEATLSLARFSVGKARFRRSELALFIQESGAQALGIVTLISVLVGLILAFVGAVQLAMFGAEIYVANLVGIAMVRDMGAMMAAIIMAGRTGASYAAALGTMQVNEEIDALQTLGISPMEFLVLPRMLALTLMMPLLCVYSDLMGILGGAIVGIGIFDIAPMQYYEQTKAAIPLHHFGVGIFKSGVYGVIVALSGCLRGMQCGRSASAVGEATTSAVVTAIVWIIVSCSVLTVILHVVGI